LRKELLATLRGNFERRLQQIINEFPAVGFHD
jgi:hypothetical protein